MACFLSFLWLILYGILPVAGMPLTVTRAYDSRDKRAGDLGVGWSLSVSDARIQKNGVVGGTDQMQVWNSHKVIGGGLFPTYALDAVKPRIVTITLPDGTVYSFHAKVEPQQLQPITEGVMEWEAQPGTKGTLQVVGDNYFYSSNMLKDTYIFKTPELTSTDIYCTDVFRDLVVQHGWTGLEITQLTPIDERSEVYKTP